MSTPAQQVRTRAPRIAQQAVERARLSVVPRVRTRAPKVPFIVLVSLVLVGGVVGLLMFNTSMSQASFASAKLEKQADALAAREQTLQRELEALRNPQRVATQAQQMGMVVPQSPTFLDLQDGTVTGPAAPAVAEDRLQLEGRRAVKPAELEPERTVVKVRGDKAGREAASRDGAGSASGARRGE
ncbi:MAG: hypothetical protein ACI379_12405 [Nocardioides sp.]|uniref:hypothetical protein n=1 Tax=Nocardioides sp. TaxID=35761 RepID=UPI003F0D7930